MAISLQTNVSSLSITSKLNKTSDVLGKSYNRLSTGLRITRPGDDPAGSQIADTLRAKSKIAAVAIQNANTALSFTSVADPALSGITDLFARMAELSQQSANGAYSNTQQSALSGEFLVPGSEIERIAVVTEFNGVKLPSYSSTATIQVGLDGGANSQIRLNALQGTLQSLGLASTGSSQMSFSIIATTETESLNAISSAVTSLNTTRGSIGAMESRL